MKARKSEVIVLGRGLAAAALAVLLVEQGRRVALLVEEPGWEQGVRPAWPGWHLPIPGVAPAAAHEAPDRLAAAGAALLAKWHAGALPGIEAQQVGHPDPLWLLDYGQLLPALGARVAAGERSWCAENTHVRGLSVIENAALGAVAEDARYDARVVVNAAEDERHAAFSRMLRQPGALALSTVVPEPSASPRLADSALAAFPGAQPFARDGGTLYVGPATVKGAWQVRGVAGWPLLALGAAAWLAEQV